MSLSQSDVLDEVLGWTTHEYGENLAETLPRVLERLKNSKTSEDLADDKIRAIKIVCINLLPCIKLKDVENRVFSKLFVEITNILNDYFSFIGKCLQINENSQDRDKRVVCEKVNTLLRKILSLLECCESCVLYALGFDDAISITDISSLSECIVYLVERTYKHCKESSSIYKDYNLEEFSEVLSMMFKKSHSIQINFLSLMDKLQLPSVMTDHIVQVLNTVCTGLFKICQTVMSLDIKLIVSLWKSISRLVVQYVQFLGEVVDVSAMIVYLCQEIKTGYQYLIEQMPNLDQQDTTWNQTDEKSFQKSLKILGFEIKILLSLCKECLEFINELKTDHEIYKLLIFIHKNTPQWLCKKITPEHTEEINRQIVMTCQPLITIFVERPKFRNCLLGPLKITEKDCFAQLLVLITITKSFTKMCEESQNGWMGISKPYEANYDDIVETIFQLMTNCHCELSNSNILLPGIMCSGNAHRLVSVYEYLAIHICGFIGSLLSKYFMVLEKALLKPIFSKCSYVRMLAIDCWCFMNRYGNSDLCRKHINLFLDVFHNSHFHPVINEDYSICNLIRRLIRFLESDDQTELMLKNSEPVSLEFWCICPIVDQRLQPQQKTIIDNVIVYCVSLIDNWVKSVNQTLNSLSSAILACGCINNILQSGIHGEITSQIKIISDKLTLVWNIMCLYDWDQCLEMEAFLAILVQLLPFIQNNLTDINLVEIFTLLKEISGNNPSTFLLTDIVKFIENCSSSTFASVEIPMLIQDILLSSLANGNCVISHMTVETITNFAENTSHNEIIPNCLKIDTNLEQKIINFINKLIIREINLSNFLKSQSDQLKIGNVLTWPEEVKRNGELMNENEITVAKQPNKRLRIDEDWEDSSHESLLKNLESDWSTFERLSVTKPVPDWFKSSARPVLEKFLRKIEEY